MKKYDIANKNVKDHLYECSNCGEQFWASERRTCCIDDWCTGSLKLIKKAYVKKIAKPKPQQGTFKTPKQEDLENRIQMFLRGEL